ncbi:MAG: hypothetical protein AAFX78_12535 [Cyanobacteria bacterium J06638_20]
MVFKDTFNLTRGLKAISVVTDSDTISIAEEWILPKTTVLNLTRPDISSKSGHVGVIESPERLTKWIRALFDSLHAGFGETLFRQRLTAIAINHHRLSIAARRNRQ